MELIKAHEIPAKEVKSWAEIKDIVPEFLAFLKAQNGSFRGEHSTCYALAHAQVSETPYAFFIVDEKYVKGTSFHDLPKEQEFPSQVIVNPTIVGIPKRIKKEVPVKKGNELIHELVDMPNDIWLHEGCMSFPHKKAKKVQRYFEIEVEYQIPKTILGFTYLKVIRETVRGLKAHVFQHEVEHMRGENMYYRRHDQIT